MHKRKTDFCISSFFNENQSEKTKSADIKDQFELSSQKNIEFYLSVTFYI
jgi:hypothetical protein